MMPTDVGVGDFMIGFPGRSSPGQNRVVAPAGQGRRQQREILEYGNTRGAGKVMDAGYDSMGLSLQRIFNDLPRIPFRDHVWPGFLRDSAVRVFDLNVAP